MRPENRELCGLAELLCEGKHFLDLSAREQQALLELRDETKEREKQSARSASQAADIAARDASDERKRVDRAERAAKEQQQKLEVRIHKCGKSYSKLLPNLQVDPEALKRLASLDGDNASFQIEQTLGSMNAGHAVYRDSISGTDPKIYEVKAGRENRIYFYRKGTKLYIRLWVPRARRMLIWGGFAAEQITGNYGSGDCDEFKRP